MCAVYAFARRVDDIGDGDAARWPQARAAAPTRAADRRLAERASGDPVLVALADADAAVRAAASMRSPT